MSTLGLKPELCSLVVVSVVRLLPEMYSRLTCKCKVLLRRLKLWMLSDVTEVNPQIHPASGYDRMLKLKLCCVECKVVAVAHSGFVSMPMQLAMP